MNKFLAAFLLLLGSGMFSGCIFGRKAHKSVTQGTDTTVAVSMTDTAKVAGTVITIPNNVKPPATGDTTAKIKTDSTQVTTTVLTPQQLATGMALWQKPFTYTTFEGKAKMHYEGNGSGNDFNATFRIKKDSVIWVFVNALGGIIPVARAFITPDSIKIVNYLSKEVTLMPITDANRLLPAPVDFTKLQNLITGQPLLNNGSVTNMADSALAWVVSVADNSYLQQLTVVKTDSSLKVQELATTNPNGPKVHIQQNGFIKEEGRQFSRLRNIHIDNNGNQYDVTMDFTSQSFNGQLDFPFSYSSKYAVNPVK